MKLLLADKRGVVVRFESVDYFVSNRLDIGVCKLFVEVLISDGEGVVLLVDVFWGDSVDKRV